MLLVFNNTSSNYFQANVETKARGTKSFCIYCDNDASEDDNKVTKQLPPNTARSIVIMKYTNSSLFSISYSVSASSAAAASTNKNTSNTNTNTIEMILYLEQKVKLLMKMVILCNILRKKKMDLLLVLKIKEELKRNLNLY